MSQEQAQQTVKRIIKEEFQQSLTEEILPEVEKAIKQGLEQVRNNLTRVDDELFKKIVNDERRNDILAQMIEQKMQHYTQQQQQNQLQMRQF